MRRAFLALLGTAGGFSALFAAWPALSADTPHLKTSANNTVPTCVAPARLMQHITKLNPRLDPRFLEVAANYQSHGQSLGLRWDYAFFHMLAETGNLTFTGDVTKDHNNFAGIRTAEGTEPERFADMSTGVLAHLHHIRLYAGDPVPKPAAKRTKQVEGFILKWSRDLKRPVRFDDMIGRWSPNKPGYARTIENALKDYQLTHCSAEVAADAVREERAASAARKSAEATPDASRAPARHGADESQQATAAAREPARPTTLAANASRLGMPVGHAAAAMAPPATPPTTPAAPGEPASLAGGAAGTAAAAGAANCKVWSASFGGEKSVLIRVADGTITHFTALQVNTGREKEETTAYIAAYARGGKTVGEFTSADQAINRAFELCPKT